MKKLVNKIKDTFNILSSSKGFTLLELLVVVLIIGILTAIALPQYRKATEKAKVNPMLSILKSLYQSEESYYLTYNNYATKFNQLDIDLPWQTTSEYWNGHHDTVKDKREYGEWIMEIVDANHALFISAGRKSGKYTGTGFQIVLNPKDYRLKKGNFYCSEYLGSPHNFTIGEYCPKIFKTATISSYPGATRMYRLNNL